MTEQVTPGASVASVGSHLCGQNGVIKWAIMGHNFTERMKYGLFYGMFGGFLGNWWNNSLFEDQVFLI